MKYSKDFDDLQDNNEVTKVNLFNSIIESPKEEKIRILKFIFADLDLLTIKQASDRLGITPNGVRQTREIIELGGKKYVRLD